MLTVQSRQQVQSSDINIATLLQTILIQNVQLQQSMLQGSLLQPGVSSDQSMMTNIPKRRDRYQIRNEQFVENHPKIDSEGFAPKNRYH